MMDWQTDTFGCIVTSPSHAPIMLPMRLPTAMGISHQPSSHARMLRVDQTSAYSFKRSRVRRGIAPNERLIRDTGLSRTGNSLHQSNTKSLMHAYYFIK